MAKTTSAKEINELKKALPGFYDFLKKLVDVLENRRKQGKKIDGHELKKLLQQIGLTNQEVENIFKKINLEQNWRDFFKTCLCEYLK